MVNSHCNFVIFLLMIYSSGVVAQNTPEIICPNHLEGTIKLDISSFTVHENKTGFYDIMAVFVKNGLEEHLSNAIQGQYSTEGDYLIFKPYFPFESGLTYVIKTKNANTDNKYFQPLRSSMFSFFLFEMIGKSI
ncbi:MAG: hypothetical protein AAFZ15_32975, partial [Bacteroidota bacterium]